MKRVYVCFPEGKFKALTLSYDDGKIMDRRLVDIFNRYKLKATFHLNSDEFGCSDGHQYPYIDEKEVKQLYLDHEVACHTCSHPTMTRLSDTQNIHEVLENRKALEAITSQMVRGMSYPNGVYNQKIKDIMKICGVVYSRTTKDTFRFDIPQDFLEWHPTCHHNKDLLKLTQKFVETTYNQRLMLFYVWGHSYEFERDMNWNLIEEFASQVSQKEDIWYATNIDIYDYMKSSGELQYSADGMSIYNPSFQSIWLSVDNQIVEVQGGQTIWLKSLMNLL